ncbi:MAG: multicopper oxidase domain-containing protein, partial [Nitrospirae bacterium]|nr:multicopper oxidase domain-containing protein [Nitrospirota bacterium]
MNVQMKIWRRNRENHFPRFGFSLIPVLLVLLVITMGAPDRVLAQGPVTWGANTYGMLGTGTTWPSGSLSPVPVSGLDGATMIAASGHHTLARKYDGTVWAWGWNLYGQLGALSVDTCLNGDPCSLVPIQVNVNALSGATALAAGFTHSLAVDTTGKVWTWGANNTGQLGDGTDIDRVSPASIGLSNVIGIAGGSWHSLAVDTTGTVWAWGQNNYGQLGTTSSGNCGGNACSKTYLQVTDLNTVVVKAVSAGHLHSLALTDSGTVYAWGNNGFGQLGDTTTTHRSSPVLIVGLAGVIAIAAGSNYNLALKTDGTVWAWGLNDRGQLGAATTGNCSGFACSSTPVKVSLSPGVYLTGVTAIASGGAPEGAHSLALRDDGTVWAWGGNTGGQLGDGTDIDRPFPVPVPGLRDGAAIAAGTGHSVFIRGTAAVVSATDVNSANDIFEAYLTADEQDVIINGTTVHAMVYKDDPPGRTGAPAGIPAPEIKVKVGDTVIVHLKNKLENSSQFDNGKTSIHWHGIELDNESDGTAVTQDAIVPPGGVYTYRFKVKRPGFFWYHPHMMPTQQDFAGMYGTLVVESDTEIGLKGATGSVIPTEAYTHTIVLSDIYYDSSGNVGIDRNGVVKTLNNFIDETCLAGNQCNVSPAFNNFKVLVNGETPGGVAQTPKYVVPSGQNVRLRLVNTAISRYFRLKVLNNGSDNNLYRIGGEGGLLDQVRREGGSSTTIWPGYLQGEIVLAPGDRADVIIRPTGNPGANVQIVGEPLTVDTVSGNNDTSKVLGFQMGAGLQEYPILFFKIGTSMGTTSIAEGDAILPTAEYLENIKDDPISGQLLNPTSLGSPGSNSPIIKFTLTDPNNPPQFPSIDGTVAGVAALDTTDDFAHVAHPTTARYAMLGDLIELSVKNETGANHPFHLHGFSFQPVRYVKNSDNSTLYNFNYDEFIDTIDVYANTTLVFRVRLEDREKLCDDQSICTDNLNGGGAIGRWVFHCHIFHHAALGMMSELVVDGDDDNDGMPNSWETRYELKVNDPADASAYSDGDIYTNLEEFIGGSDPKVTTSVPTNVSTIPYNQNPYPNSTIRLVAPPNVVIDSFAWIDPVTLPSNPNGSFPYGLVSIKLTGVSQGGSVTVALTFPGDVNTVSHYYKYGPTATPAWYEFPFGSNDGDKTITLTLTDGGAGDHDESANTEIVDPGGPFLPATRLTNISTRAFVGTGSDIAVGGFIISGTGTKQVLIRGFGPTLVDFGISGALDNPTLNLYWDDDNNPSTAGILVLTNNDWGSDPTSCPAPVVA